MSLDDTLKKIIIEVSGLNISAAEISDETSLVEDLGFHSLLSVRLFVELEKALGIMIDEEYLNYDILTSYYNLRECVLKSINA